MRFISATVPVVLACVLFCGCAARHPQPLAAPLTTIAPSIYSGSALSGPTTRPVDAQQTRQALIASVDLIALDTTPSILNPIAGDVRLIVQTRGDDAIQSNGQLTQPLRWEVGGAGAPQIKGGSAQMAHHVTAVPRGACAVVRVIDEQRPDRGFDILLQQSPTRAGEFVLAVAISDRAGAGDKPEAKPVALSREMAVLKPITITEATPIALLIPFQFTKSRAQSVLATMEIRPATNNADDATLVADASAQIDKSRAIALAAAKSSPATQPLSGYEAAMWALDDPASRRASLAFLSRQLHAPLCEDFALVGDASALEGVVKKIKEQLKASNASRDEAATGWTFDSSALSLAAELQSKDQLPPELLSFLIRHTGQVGMNSGSVGELLASTKSRKEFEARVLAENLIYLEDGSPAARARAFDWLTAQGKSPAGYDPLAPPRQRQDALQKMYDAMNAQTVARDGGRP